MKREFLESLDLGEGVKMPKSAIDAIMAENGRDIEAKNNTITTLTTERDGLQTQLTAANTTIQSYKDMDIDGIKAKAGEWETKYNTDTQALKDQLAATEYGFAVKEAVAGLKFSSESAKRAFVADLTAKKLPLQEGKLLGLPPNRVLTDEHGVPYDLVCGTFFLVGVGEERFTSLTEEQIRHYQDKYSREMAFPIPDRPGKDKSRKKERTLDER